MALKVYERYLLREVIAATGLVLAAFVMLFGFFDLIAEVQDIGRGTYQLPEALTYVTLTLPGRIYELAPIATLIGALYAVTNLARHSEITVLRASGLSTWGLMRTLLKLGLLFAVLTFLVGEFVAPRAERVAQQLRLKSMSAMVAQEFRSGVWLRDEHSFINIRTVTPESELQDVRIYEFDTTFKLQAIVDAVNGEYMPDGTWLLKKVTRTGFEATRSVVDHSAELRWQSAITPEMLTVLMVAPDKMPILTLYEYIQHLSENKQKTERYQIAFWKKLAYPLSLLVMLILALPFAYLHVRAGGVSLKVFLGIMLGIGFHLLNGLFASLGAINEWHPILAAVTPGLIFLAGAGVLLFWVERR